jgi:hypothetical protein
MPDLRRRFRSLSELLASYDPGMVPWSEIITGAVALAGILGTVTAATISARSSAQQDLLEAKRSAYLNCLLALRDMTAATGDTEIAAARRKTDVSVAAVGLLAGEDLANQVGKVAGLMQVGVHDDEWADTLVKVLTPIFYADLRGPVSFPLARFWERRKLSRVLAVMERTAGEAAVKLQARAVAQEKIAEELEAAAGERQAAAEELEAAAGERQAAAEEHQAAAEELRSAAEEYRAAAAMREAEQRRADRRATSEPPETLGNSGPDRESPDPPSPLPSAP